MIHQCLQTSGLLTLRWLLDPFLANCPVSSKSSIHVHVKTSKHLQLPVTHLGQVTSEDVYAGPCDAARIAGELDMEEHKQGIRNIAFSMPFPVYCRTDTNKIAYCNKNFASLYGQNDVAVLIGSSTLNILLDKNEEKTPRDIKHNKEARKNQECIEYTEDGVLPDGREVVFVCHEQPIVFLPFKNTTVVFMNPTDGKGNTLKFHVDGWFNATKEEDYRLRTSSARKTEHVRLTSAYDEDATAAVPKPI